MCHKKTSTLRNFEKRNAAQFNDLSALKALRQTQTKMTKLLTNKGANV